MYKIIRTDGETWGCDFGQTSSSCVVVVFLLHPLLSHRKRPRLLILTGGEVEVDPKE